MINEEILQYNRMCAEFLGWEQYSDLTERFYGNWKPSVIIEKPWTNRVELLFFHSDWNWIMEVIDEIERTNIVDIFFLECVIYKNQGTIGPHNDIITWTTGTSKKEAVVQAINQFLIWHNEQTNI